MPLSFEENTGQTDLQVRFLSRPGPYRVYMTKNSVVLDLRGHDGHRSVLRTTFLGASPMTDIRGTDKQIWVTNYLVGSRAEWKTSVPNYAKVTYSSVYPGINLLYYGTEGRLEYDFSIAPYADPSPVKLRVEGANKITVNREGSLVLETAAGIVSWKRPFAYQGSGQARRIVSATYRVSENTVAFDIGPYDKNLALVIDPVLDYGTYLDGSNGFDYWRFLPSLRVDSAGFAYVLGFTSSTDFPTTPGAYQSQITDPAGLSAQTFVAKLSQDGSSLVWSTIIGGSGPFNFSQPSGFALDRRGNVYIVGSTADRSFSSTTQTFTYFPSTYPTTPGAYNTNPVPTQLSFLTKLNSSGSALVYSTFLAGQANLEGFAVAVDAADSAYVTGAYMVKNSFSAPFPCTPAAYQCNYAGQDDAFIMKLNAQGNALDYATLVGGSENDDAHAITVNSRGEATISGPTYSPDYPIASNGLRQIDEGGFVTTVNSAGTGLIFSTVLNHVFQLNVKRDGNGDDYVGGSAGTDLPVTQNAYQKTFLPDINASNQHGFLTVIDTSGNLVYSSYFGGDDTTIQRVSPTQVTVTGLRGNDPSFPVTDLTYEQDTCEFLAQLNPRASSGTSSLLYSGCTPVNITDNLYVEAFRGIPGFAGGVLHLAGPNNLYALSAAGPTSPNAFQANPPNRFSGDGIHLWVGKYDLGTPGQGGINLSGPYYGGGPPFAQYVRYRATASSPQCAQGIAAMRVYISPGVWANTTLGAALNATIAFPNFGSYDTVVVAYDNCGNAFTKDVPILVNGSSGTMGSVGVTSPATSTVSFLFTAVSSPVHYIANAQAPACSNGIAAMRIYTAPGVAAYTVNAPSLDTSLSLPPGAYNTVVQAWDNCGHVFQAPVNILVR